jgi:hypothetical protein
VLKLGNTRSDREYHGISLEIYHIVSRYLLEAQENTHNQQPCSPKRRYTFKVQYTMPKQVSYLDLVLVRE